MSTTHQSLDKKSYQCTVVTPHGVVFSGEILSLKAPGHAGEFGVLANHAPIVTVLTKGILVLHTSEKESFWVITSGVLEVVPTSHDVLLLVDSAAPAKTLDDAASILNDLKSKKV